MKPERSKAFCKTCRFYDGEHCRRNPPVRLPRRFVPDATAGSRVRDEELIWGWPETKPDDWCGEFDIPLTIGL